MADQVSLADSIRNIPPVTRFFTTTTVVVCLANSLRIIQPHQLMCSTSIVIDRLSYVQFVIQHGKWFQIILSVGWVLLQSYRFFTCFLLPVGIIFDQPFQAILDIYFFYTFANHVESVNGKFKGNFPDCLWFTLTAGTIIVILTLIYGLIDSTHFSFHHQMMLSCITYIWSRSLKNSIINFLGLLPIKAYYLPLFNVFFKLILNGYSSFMDLVFGILGGYLYQCIQSNTLPIYNLFPSAYNQGTRNRAQGRRVGTSGSAFNVSDANSANDLISDSIFDKGYLKAPLWLYRLLNYPYTNSKRTTAFTPPTSNVVSPSPEENSNPGSWFGYSSAFQGRGRRLGD